jgi:tetratricopeptide (TPR) repeat protein
MAKKQHKQHPQGRPQHTGKVAERGNAAVSGSGATFGAEKWVALGLALLAFALYANTLGHGFVLDDPLAITKNSVVSKGAGAMPQLLFQHYRMGTEGANASALLYRPLSLMCFALEWSIAPGKPGIGHFMNVLWYALGVGLLYLALRRMAFRFHWLWAAGAALLFAAHPVHTEVVANIKSRDEILAWFFGVAALYHWAGHLGGKGGGRALIWAGGCYFLSLLSKESAVTMLPVFPLVAWTFFGRGAGQSLRQSAWALGPVLLFFLFRTIAFSRATDAGTAIDVMDNPLVAASGFGERSATAFAVLWHYLQLLFFPQPLLSDYSFRHFPLCNWGDPKALAGLVAYATLGAYSIWGMLRRQALAFCVAAFLCAISLYSQLAVVIGTLLGERLLFMPSLWFCLGLVLVLFQLAKLPLHQPEAPSSFGPKTALGMGLVGVFALFFAFKTIQRNPDWRSNLTLFSADSPKAPNSVRLRNGLAEEMYLAAVLPTATAEQRAGFLKVTEENALAAVAIRPNPNSFINLGNVAFVGQNHAQAEQHYLKALELAPNMTVAKRNLAQTYANWGRMEGQKNNNLARCAELYEKAIQFGENNVAVWQDLGTAYGMLGNTAKAIEWFEKTTQADPKNKQAWMNLSIAYRQIGDFAKADACLQRAQ